MKENLIDLNKSFLEIKKKGFIKSKRKGSTGIGYTFEELLNKNEDNFSFPDYNGIEIKTFRRNSRQEIHLFSATPDGDFLFPIDRLIRKLGYPDRLNPNHKVFNMRFNGKCYTKIGLYKLAKIFVENEKISFNGYDRKYGDLKMDISWSFELLRKKLEIKLNYLAIIKAENKYINNEEYFFYYDIKFYKLKSFDVFIDLLKKGFVTISFNVGVYRDKKRDGKMHDRGTGFKIKVKDLNLLFDEISI